MKLYADRPARYTAQIVSDLFAIMVIAGTVWLGLTVHDQVVQLRAPGDGLVNAGSGLRNTFDAAADHADDLPLIGGALAGALHSGSTAGTQLADAGRWQIEAVENLALWIAVVLIAVPVMFLLVTWLPLRWRFVSRATAAVRLRDLGEAGQDLLALRALTTQRLSRLAGAGDVTAGWRDRDPAVLARLARWELARLGLRTRPSS
ncbi:MAG TPA: hypothetical protein VJT49_11295 [Amycolatopsis sp.]|uniref:hypothetical protein n=1 Tax=Amycolatopsis sp. TaxID=37632 RepID=UPI002B486697|nr:hypothetical protein [Amycolatopsis sp.]HKS45675.1 hypothetical protein [Amycolatopsis sp.]